MRPLPVSFYARDTVTVARELLGMIMIRRIGGSAMSGIISETEAYRSDDDPASHAFGGITKRNAPMFGQVGCAYVYFTYGMHHCMNVVARSGKKSAGAVLIRAITPQEGTRQMMRNRDKDNEHNLTDGPAKLAQALRITRRHSGVDLTELGGLYIIKGTRVSRARRSPRIGIKRGTQNLWNFSPYHRASRARPGQVS